MCMQIYIAATYDPEKAGDLSTLFDVGGIIGKSFVIELM